MATTATLSVLKLVDDKTKYLIYGYLNEIERELLDKNNKMPMDIKNLCILFYFIKEQFKIHGSYLKLTSKLSKTSQFMDTVTRINDSEWTAAYGEFKIDPDIYPNSIFIWTLKIHQITHTSILFGISSTNTVLNDLCFGLKNKGIYYSWNPCLWGFMSNDGSYYPTSKINCNANDIIKIIFDIKENRLNFNVNGKDIGGFDNIDISVSYYLAVALYYEHDCVQITDFDVKTSKQ